MHTIIGRYMAGTKRKELGTQRWKRLRLRVLDRDDKICAYCGGEADTVDHVISRADGGDTWDMENLVAACKRCNSSKGRKAFFLQPKATPPAFPAVSLPATQGFRPDSPFEKPA